MNWVLIFWLIFTFAFMWYKFFFSSNYGSELAPTITLGVYSGYLVMGAILVSGNEIRKSKRDYVGEKLRLLGCKELTRERNEEVYDWVQQAAKEQNIPRLEIYLSDIIRNNAFSISGRDRNILVISSNVIDSLDFSGIEAILRHEFYHLKFFTANKFEYLIGQPEFDHRKTLFKLLLIPLFVITIFADYFSASTALGNFLLLEGAEVESFLVMLGADGGAYVILVLIYVLVIDGILTFSRKSAKMYSAQLSELLSDAFSVLEKKNFREFRELILSLSSEKGGSSRSSEIYECFGSGEIISTEEQAMRDAIQEKRRLEHEKTGVLHNLTNMHWQYESQNLNNWVDIIHNYRDKGCKYDLVVRLEFINDLQKLCEEHVALGAPGSGKGFFKELGDYDQLAGDLDTMSVLSYILGIHGVSNKLLGPVFKYIRSHENDFNLKECAKDVGQTEFIVFVVLLKHILHRNVFLKWRYPLRNNFDYC